MNYGIEIKNLSFSYGETPVLDNINLSVKIGGAVGIAGVSGGGKSTLLKLISGLYEAPNGIITVMGVSSPIERIRNVAMVMQNAVLFPASIRDNITCGHLMDEAEIINACEAACLCDWINSLPAGLDTFVGERSGRVSGGQAQRIAIARAVAKNSPVVLLDEPTSALDRETGAAVLAALENLARGRTVIHVSHVPETLKSCGRLLRLEGGCLHAS